MISLSSTRYGRRMIRQSVAPAIAVAAGRSRVAMVVPRQPSLQVFRSKSTSTAATKADVAVDETINPDSKEQEKINTSSEIVKWRYHRKFLQEGRQEISSRRKVPKHIVAPKYATVGDTISSFDFGKSPFRDPANDPIPIYNQPKDEIFLNHMREAGQIAATTLRMACDYAQMMIPSPVLTSTDGGGYYFNTITTDHIDELVHTTLIETHQAYPSPFNYATFPKSVCTSVNEVICHGIPECIRELHYGDVLSIDVSCYTKNRVHGDNCATIIVGDYNSMDDNATESRKTTKAANASTTNSMNDIHIEPSQQQQQQQQCDWRNVPYRTQFATTACHDHFIEARRLMTATREALMTSIQTIVPNQSYLSDIGRACQTVAEQYGYTSVTKYRGHGIGTEFHMSPFIKHYTNYDQVVVKEGMIFTIEPMLCQYSAECEEWKTDQWTVTTVDQGLACQFEHTILVTKTGVEILTLPFGHPKIGMDYYTTVGL